MNKDLISEIEKVLEKFITHILWYHDKECGRTEDVEIIFKSRFKDLALAIAKICEVKVPKKNKLPLELRHCVMEIYRKSQNLTPLLNQVRNDAIDEFLRLNPNIMKEE